MRIAVGEIKQEANTFSPILTTLADFRAEHLLVGQEVLGLTGTQCEIGGFLTAAITGGHQVVPLLAGSAISGGALSLECHEWFEQHLCRELQANLPVDAVYLALHGAMVSDVPGGEDATGLLLSKVRELAGPGVPVMATLDLHANVTRLMVESSSALIGYRTWPHVDQAERGAEAAALLERTVAGHCIPTAALSKLRVILPVENGQTSAGPMADLVSMARCLEAAGACLSASVFLVQPWLDVPETGCAVVIVTDDDGDAAQRLADRIALEMWQRRDAFIAHLIPVEEAVDRALAANGKPVVLADPGDSTSSGAPGDSTAILEQLLARNVTCPVLLPIVDREAVRLAQEVGKGRRIALELGARFSAPFSHPVHIEAEVRFVGPASFRFAGPVLTGMEVKMGMTAVLSTGPISIVVTERPTWTVDPGMYRAVGLEPDEAQVVVVKSPNMFRAAYAEMAHEIIVVDTPGVASSNLLSLPFTRLPRPCYPFDKDWAGAPWAPIPTV